LLFLSFYVFSILVFLTALITTTDLEHDLFNHHNLNQQCKQSKDMARL